MNISAMLSMLKVTEEAMKLLNDIEVHSYIRISSLYIHTICIASLLYNDYASIHYPHI